MELLLIMKAIITGERQSDIVSANVPEPKGDWVVVKVHASAMCTEYKAWLDGSKKDWIGLEGAGEVVAFAGELPFKIGDRVVVMPQLPCNRCDICLAGDFCYCEDDLDHSLIFGSSDGRGTFSHYVIKPHWQLLPIPEKVSYESATMAIDGIGASFGGMQAIGVSAFDTVLITGLGPVGLGGIINAKYRGARVIAIEPSDWRRSLGAQLGAEIINLSSGKDILSEIIDITNGKGVDCAVDCSGTVQGQRLCIDSVRRRGRVSFVGGSSKELTITVSRDMIRKGLHMQGNWLYNRADYKSVMRVIEDSPLIEKLVSHVMPMSKIQEGFSLLAAGEAAKIVLNPWE